MQDFGNLMYSRKWVSPHGPLRRSSLRHTESAQYLVITDPDIKGGLLLLVLIRPMLLYLPEPDCRERELHVQQRYRIQRSSHTLGMTKVLLFSNAEAQDAARDTGCTKTGPIPIS